MTDPPDQGDQNDSEITSQLALGGGAPLTGKTATLAWLVFVVAAIAIGHTVGTHMLTDAEQSTGETAQAESLLAHAHFNTPAQESVLNSQSNSPVKGEPRWEES